MRECFVCGDNDYQEIAGYFYCTTCNTQSQSTRVEVNEAEFEDFGGHFTQLLEMRKDSKEKQTKKKMEEKGDPWSIYEAYQLIIQHQVEALIELGAKPELKDIVFKIWTNYLSKLGVAFSDTGIAEPLSKRSRQREMFPGTTYNPKVKNVLGRSKRRKTVGVSPRTMEKETEQLQLAEILQAAEGGNMDSSDKVEGKSKKRKRQMEKSAEMVFDSDDNNNDDNNDEHSGEELMDPNLDVDGEKLDLMDNMRRRNLQGDSCYKMQMVYTLSFCYLGLMATNPLTTLVDIIRWVNQEKIPYVDVKDLLSSKMKFCLHDWKLFGEGVIPDLTRLRTRTSSLGRFLALNGMPCMRFPMEDLLVKYILMLDLPAECNQMVRSLYHSLVIPRSLKGFIVGFWEGKAMAIIIIFLKMLLGIDDKSERLFSTYSKDLNTELYEGELKVFVWDKWIGHVAKKILLIDIGNNTLSEDETKRLDRRTKATKLSDIKLKLYRVETREKIRKPFDELSERWHKPSRRNELDSSTQPDNGDKEDGFNIAQDTLVVEDPSLEYLMNRINDSIPDDQDAPRMNDSEQKKILQAGEIFRRCTVQHLVNPKMFLSQQGISVSEPESQSDQEPDSDNSLDSDHEKFSSSGEEGNSQKLSSSKSKSSKKRPANKVSQNSKSPSTSSNLNQAKCLAIIKQVAYIKAHYRIAVRSEKTSSHSSSYNWLLQLGSKFLHCKSRELQHEIDKLEINLVPKEIQKEMMIRRKTSKEKIFV